MSTVCQIDALLAGITDPNTGLPAAGGSVEFYVPGSSTGKNVWEEADKSTSHTSYTLDNAGAATLFGDGNYDVTIKNASGSTIYEWESVNFSKREFETTTMATDYSQVADDDAILLSQSATANRTLTLLAPTSFGNKPLYIFNENATYSLTVSPASGNIDGESSITLSPESSGIIVYTDGTNFFSSLRTTDTITATDGSDRAAQVTEDGLEDQNEYQNAFFITGSTTESHRITNVGLEFTYDTATTIIVEVSPLTMSGYNDPANVESSGIASGGNDSGIYITGNSAGYITDDILSPSPDDDCQLVAVLGWSIVGNYQLSTSGPPELLFTISGSYPSSTLNFYYYEGGSAVSLFSALNTTGDNFKVYVTYLSYLVA